MAHQRPTRGHSNLRARSALARLSQMRLQASDFGLRELGGLGPDLEPGVWSLKPLLVDLGEHAWSPRPRLAHARPKVAIDVAAVAGRRPSTLRNLPGHFARASFAGTGRFCGRGCVGRRSAACGLRACVVANAGAIGAATTAHTCSHETHWQEQDDCSPHQGKRLVNPRPSHRIGRPYRERTRSARRIFRRRLQRLDAPKGAGPLIPRVEISSEHGKRRSAKGVIDREGRTLFFDARQLDGGIEVDSPKTALG